MSEADDELALQRKELLTLRRLLNIPCNIYLDRTRAAREAPCFGLSQSRPKQWVWRTGWFYYKELKEELLRRSR